MSLLHRFAVLSACSLLASGLTFAQQQPPVPQPKASAQQAPGKPQERPTFTSTATEVIVPVTVTDNKGKFVSNLVAADFRVLDEGKPQRIQFFSHAEKQPIVVGFLVDQSNAMKIHWQKYHDLVDELVFNLLPGDARYSGYLISYSNDAELKVDTTNDAEKILAQLNRMKPAGGAALFEAIYKACTTRSLIKGEPYEPRRIIIIIGDGHNSAGGRTLDQVIELAKRNLVTIYGVSTAAFGMAAEEGDNLERLANETGGHVEYPLNNPYKDVSGYLSNPQDAGNYAMTVGTGAYASQIAAGITRAAASLLGEITTQYVLRYVPDFDPEGKPKVFRRIKVDIPSLPGINIHAKDGYYPNPVPGQGPAN
jgi:Ca-activated chloride channel homolog